MNIYKRYGNGFSIMELILAIALFSVVIAGMSKFSSSISKYFQTYKVKQNSQSMYNLFRSQLKQDLVGAGSRNIELTDDTTSFTIKYDLWNNGNIIYDGKKITYEAKCMDSSDYEFISNIKNLYSDNVKHINTGLIERIGENYRQFGCLGYKVCGGGKTLPIIVRTEKENDNVIRTTFYPTLETGVNTAASSGTIAATMCIPTQEEGSFRVFFMRVYFTKLSKLSNKPKEQEKVVEKRNVMVKEDTVFVRLKEDLMRVR